MTTMTTICLVLCLLGLALAAPYKENDDEEVNDLDLEDEISQNPFFSQNVTDLDTLDRSAVVDNTNSDPVYQAIKRYRMEYYLNKYADPITDETSVRDFDARMATFASFVGFVPLADNDPDTIVDVSIRFWPTKEVVREQRGEYNMKMYAQWLVDETNKIFQNSGVKIHLTTPCVTKASWFSITSKTWWEIQDYMQTNAGSFMQTNDLSVVLISDNVIHGHDADALGMSSVFEVLNGKSDIVVKARRNNWILAHEIGHHMGLEHYGHSSFNDQIEFPYTGSVYGSVMNPRGPQGWPHRFSSSAPGKIGDEDHDNVRLLNRLRFVLSRSGNEGSAPRFPCMV